MFIHQSVGVTPAANQSRLFWSFDGGYNNNNNNNRTTDRSDDVETTQRAVALVNVVFHTV